jgi:hypothetical protein
MEGTPVERVGTSRMEGTAVTTDLLARIREELDERMAALRPLLSEYERLVEAADTLAAIAAGELAPLDGTPAPVTLGAEGTSEQAPSGEQPSPEEPAESGANAGPPGGEGPFAEAAPERAATAEKPSGERPSAGAAPEGEATAGTAPSTLARRRGRPPRGSAAGAFGLAMSLRTTPPIQPIARHPTPTATRGTSAPPPLPSEPHEWRTPMPGVPAAGEPPLSAHGAAEAGETSASLLEDTGAKREPLSPAAAQQAILAALEHGSHTPGELVMVTAMTPAEVRSNLGRLARRGAVSKVKRDGDGKAAYALPTASPVPSPRSARSYLASTTPSPRTFPT